MTEAATAALHRSLEDVWGGVPFVDAEAVADRLAEYGYRVTEYLLPAHKNGRAT